MKLVPWRKIENWSCIACGDCCKEFRVPLRAYEAVRLARHFGYTCLEFNLERCVLKKRLDGRCIFQVHSNGKWICGIQNIKPLACKIWPFLVSDTPSHGFKEEAEYEYRGRKYYVYVNPFCKGIAYGRPTRILAEKVIAEFVELSLGIREKQDFSTSMLVDPRLMVLQSNSIIPVTYYWKTLDLTYLHYNRPFHLLGELKLID